MFGEHVARCMNCGKQWVVSDCIPFFCSDECHNKWRAKTFDKIVQVMRDASASDEAARAAGGEE